MTNTMIKRNGNAAANLDNVFDAFIGSNLRRFFDGNFWDPDAHQPLNTVPVNIREREQAYEMDVIAPGCRREDFNISVHDNMLIISFEHKNENNTADQDRGWSRHEFVQQSFKRSFTMDDTVDTKGISATYSDGILRLNIPKSTRAKERSRVIDIQ